MVRGLPLVLIAAALGRGTALVLVAGLVFALFHSLNPGVTPLGIGNIALAGIFLGVGFLRPRRAVDRLRRPPRMEHDARRARCSGQRFALRHSVARLLRRRAGLAFGGQVRAGGWPDGHLWPSPLPCSWTWRWARKEIAVKRAAVVGAGTMGNGIAHVFAQHGWQRRPDRQCTIRARKATATIRSNLERQVKKGSLPAEAPAEILGRISTGTALDARGWRGDHDRGSQRKSGGKVLDLRAAGPDRLALHHPRNQHQLHLDHRDRCPHPAAGAGDRHALHESGSGDAAGRGDSRATPPATRPPPAVMELRGRWGRRRSRSTITPASCPTGC